MPTPESLRSFAAALASAFAGSLLAAGFEARAQSTPPAAAPASVPAPAAGKTTATAAVPAAVPTPAAGTAGFSFLEPFASQTDAKDPGLAEARASARERLAAEETATAGFYPSANLTADTGPSKNWQWNDDGRVGADGRPIWNSQASVSLRQNVWAGGTTSLRVDAAKARTEGGRLEVERRRAALRLSMARDLADLLSIQRRITQQGGLLTQARALETIATRKNASGFLGKKELLDTQRESLRADFEVRNLTLELADGLSAFNRNYRLSNAPLDEAMLRELTAPLEAIARKGLDDLRGPVPIDAALGANRELRVNASSLEAIDKETDAARRGRLAPSLDLIAGLSGTLYDNGNLPGPQRDAAPDRGVSAYGKVQFSMNLFSPQANAQAEEALARKDSALASRARVESGVRDAFAAQASRAAQLQARIENERKLLAATEDLLQKNTRLFEAGEYDVLEVIRSQQEVARQRQALNEAESSAVQLGIAAAAAVELGVVDGGAPGAGSGVAP